MIIKNRTELAMIGLGIDSATAQKLRLTGFTLAKLKQASVEELNQLGLSKQAVKLLHTSKRPPIPPKTLEAVLYANRWSCCVCRNDTRPIVVHHINPWATSRNHSDANLAVVCALHHGRIHTRHELEQNLTPKLLAGHKEQWEAYCRIADNRLAMKDSALKFSTWFYFNHFRIHEIAKELGIKFSEVLGFAEARNKGICDSNGSIVKKCAKGDFLFSDHDRLPLYEYLSSLFFSCVKRGNINNISDYLDRGFCNTQILPGDIVMVQGLHTYTPLPQAQKGSEISAVLRKSNGVHVTSTINLEGATSTSSWCDWLRGQKNVCQILKVQDVRRESGNVVILGTTLAIRSRDANFKQRNYDARLWQSVLAYREEMNDGDDEEIKCYSDMPSSTDGYNL